MKSPGGDAGGPIDCRQEHELPDSRNVQDGKVWLAGNLGAQNESGTPRGVSVALRLGRYDTQKCRALRSGGT